jgi:hypothetical protein
VDHKKVGGYGLPKFCARRVFLRIGEHPRHAL